jgi:hypothetical protein
MRRRTTRRRRNGDGRDKERYNRRSNSKEQPAWRTRAQSQDWRYRVIQTPRSACVHGRPKRARTRTVPPPTPPPPATSSSLGVQPNGKYVDASSFCERTAMSFAQSPRGCSIMAGLGNNLVQGFSTGRANHWEFLRLRTGFELPNSSTALPCYRLP